MRFAHLKTHHVFEGLRLRSLSEARDEFHIAAFVQILKTLALRLIRPPPKLRLRLSCVALVGGVGVRQTSASSESEKT
jgi:hypothetical protein